MDDFEVDGANRYTSGDDPNKDVLQSASDSIKPQFQLGDNDSSNPSRILGNAEQNASAAPTSSADSDDTKSDANTAEKLNNSNFVSNVTGGRGEQKLTGGKAKGFLKKRGPLFVLLLLLGGGGAGIMSTQNLLPFALAKRALQEWNSSEIVGNRRYRVLLNKKLRVDTGKEHTNMFGELKISKKQKRFLKKQGIDVITIKSGGKKAKALLADDGTGKKKLIIGNGKKSGLDKEFRKSINADIAAGKLKGAKGVDFGNNLKVTTFRTALKNDNDFFLRFNYGSKAVSGHSSTWFDNVFEGVRKRLGLTRNRWFDFLRGDDEAERIKKYKERGKMPEANGKVESKVKSEEEEEDGTGNKTKKTVDLDDADAQVKGEDMKATIKNISAKVDAAAKASNTGINIICTFYAMMGTINAIKYAAEMAQILNYTSGFFEAVDKTKAGDGSESAMAEYLNDLSRPDKNGLTGLSATGIGALISGTDINTNAAFSKTADKLSRAQAESALKFNFDDAKTQSEILGDSKMQAALNGTKYTIKQMQGCAYAKIGGSAASLVVSVFTFGIGTFVKDFAKSIITTSAISLLSSFLVPKVAEMLMHDLVEGVLGPDLGNALAAGSHMYLAKNHQAGGGSPGTAEEVLAFKREQAAVLAEDARVERAILSPFDTSTNNTFLGKLAYSIIPLSTSLGSISTTTTKLSSLISSSLADLLPSASAIGETRLNQTQGVCPTQNALDIVADGFCNSYYISDTTSLGSYDQDDPLDPELLFAFVAEANDGKNFERDPETDEIQVNDEGNPIINNDLDESELFQYINYCSNRDSMWGTADQNIANSFRLLKDHSAVSTILDAVPVVDDLKDIAESAENLTNADWISGRKCVADNTGKTNPNWSERMRLYQRYMEDQRLYESMGIIEISSVKIALDDYYEEHPLDTSETGIIARLSGLTKDQVETTLAFVDYFNYIADYNPEGLYPNYKSSPIARMLGKFSAKNAFSTPTSTLYESPIFVDLRNRNFST